MRNTTLGLALLALSSCATPDGVRASRSIDTGRAPLDDALVLSPTRVRKPVKGRPTFQAPIPLPGGAVLVPFARETTAGLFGNREFRGIGDWDNFAEGGSWRRTFAGSASSELRAVIELPARWHNAVLHHFGQDAQSVVLNEKGIISRYWMCLDRANTKSPWRLTTLLFGATLEDTNGDGDLDDEDAMGLVVMEPGGGRLVTGPGQDLVTLIFDEASDHALAYLVTDENGNGKFDLMEGPVPYVVDFSGPVTVAPMVHEESRRAIDGALDGVD